MKLIRFLPALALVLSISPALADGDGGAIMPGGVPDGVGSPNAAPPGFSDGIPAFVAAQRVQRYLEAQAADHARRLAAKAAAESRG